MKRACAVEPVQDGLEFCDQSGKKWRLGMLVIQTDVELTYEGTPHLHQRFHFIQDTDQADQSHIPDPRYRNKEGI